MSVALMSALLAQTSDGGLPKGKAILMILFFGAVGIFSAVCLFASDETLRSYASFIGTKNPLVARIVCGIGVLVGLIAVIVSGLALLGVLK